MVVIRQQSELTDILTGCLLDGEFPVARGDQTSAQNLSVRTWAGLCCGFLGNKEIPSRPFFLSSRAFYKNVAEAGTELQIWAKDPVVTGPVTWRRSLCLSQIGI